LFAQDIGTAAVIVQAALERHNIKGKAFCEYGRAPIAPKGDPSPGFYEGEGDVIVKIFQRIKDDSDVVEVRELFQLLIFVCRMIEDEGKLSEAALRKQFFKQNANVGKPS
jgi:hypothetical protein